MCQERNVGGQLNDLDLLESLRVEDHKVGCAPGSIERDKYEQAVVLSAMEVLVASGNEERLPGIGVLFVPIGPLVGAEVMLHHSHAGIGLVVVEPFNCIMAPARDV